MVGVLLLMSVLGVDPTVITSQTCAVTVDGPSITEIRNLVTGEAFRPDGNSFSLYDAANKPIPLDNPVVTQSGRETIIQAASPRGDQLTATLWPDGPDICLRLEAKTAQPGLRAAGFGFSGSHEPCTFIAPILGGMELTPTTPVGHVEQMYPGSWESQLALLETAKGGVSVRSTDTEFGFKWVFFDRKRPTWGAEFRSENQAPYTERSTLRSPEWRISAHRGDWRTPTAQYRLWMEKAFGLTPFDPASWEAGIRCVVTTFPEGMTDQGLDQLAKCVRPPQTLLYVPSWRTHDYDVMYPDYDPAPGVADRVRAARARGFRVMLHTDFPGVTGTHPFYEQVKQHRLLEVATKEPIGWWLEKHVPQSFYFINPASPIYRAEFVRRMKGIQDVARPDSIHLDVSAPTWNDGGGLIDGMNYPQGARRLHDDLASALPGMVWGGEHITESTLRHERFWQVWPSWVVNNGHPHPIVTALYWPYCRGYGYLGMPDPSFGEVDYVRYLEQYDANGFLVTIPIQNLEKELSAPGPALEALFALARAHQDLLTEPDVNAMVKNGNHSVWRGHGGTIRVKSGDGLSVTALNGKAILAHGHGPRAVRGLYPCGDWPAWNSRGAFGLDPGGRYLLTPLAPKSSGFHITSITGAAARIQQIADYPDAVVLRLAEYPATPAVRLADAFGAAETFCRNAQETRPIEDGAVCQFEDHTSGSVGHDSLFILPPWHKPNADWVTGMRFRLHVPVDAELDFWMGLDDNAGQTDGATFLVYRDGEEIFRRHYTDKKWEHVRLPLGNGARRDVTLELATHPGPKNDPSWDMALFGDPFIAAPPTQSQSSARIDYTAKDLVVAHAQGAKAIRPGRLVAPAPGFAPIILFKSKPQVRPLPYDVAHDLTTPFLEQATGSKSGSAFGAGGFHKISSGGVERDALNAHPPAGGKTVFPWAVTLPAGVTTLRFTTGLGDGAETDGVTFSIRVNGEEAWQWFTAAPGWHDATVDLRSRAGQAVQIEFVTDSGKTNNSDWANWASIRIE